MYPTLCKSTEAFRFEAILLLPPPPPVDDAVRVDVLGVFLGFFGILKNFFNNVSEDKDDFLHTHKNLKLKFCKNFYVLVKKKYALKFEFAKIVTVFKKNLKVTVYFINL